MSHSWKQRTLMLSRRDVLDLLTLPECIDAVEQAFADHARGLVPAPGVLGMHLEGGGFHLKAASMGHLFATKINGNFQANESAWGLPRIQGLLVLCDARHGYPLAVMDSTEITAIRTAAATGVAARALARRESSVVTIAGCGRQSRLQLRAVATVLPVSRVFACDTDNARAAAFATRMARELRIPVEYASSVADAAGRSDVIVTCTPATRPILCLDDVRPGAFIAAVGADSEAKQEIDVALLARAAVVPDILEQAATIGDLHHAIAANVMTRDDVRAELGAVLAGLAPGRTRDDEIVVFDSTGTALQDVAAAAIVYARALARGRGIPLELLGDARCGLHQGAPLARISM
jgi:alanine dehydrogenase